MNSRKFKIALLFVSILLILAVISFLVARNSASYDISQDYPVSNNLAGTAVYDNNSLAYSTGQALVLYNYTTGAISQLSQSVGLSASGIDSLSVSSDKQYILFHDESVVVGGNLYNYLVSKGLDPQSDYWWLYSVASNSFQPLPQTTLLAKLDNNGLDALADTGSGTEAIVNYQMSDLTPISSVNVSGADNFFAANNGYYLQTPGNSILFTTNGVVSQSLLQNANLVAITTDGGQAIVVLSNNGSSQLALLDLQKNTTDIIAKKIEGQPVYNSGTILYSAPVSNTQVSLYTYNLSSKKTYLWKLTSNATSLDNASLTPVALINSRAALVSSSSTSYYLLGKNLTQPQQKL